MQHSFPEIDEQFTNIKQRIIWCSWLLAVNFGSTEATSLILCQRNLTPSSSNIVFKANRPGAQIYKVYNQLQGLAKICPFR